MTALSKRRLLQAFVGLGALGVTGVAFAEVPGSLSTVDSVGAAEIGRAWLAVRTGVTARALTADLFPRGLDDAGVRALGERARDDFRRAAIFRHKGWRLSETEARLCALIALS
ncbi:hypothetical protein BrevBR_10655 [Brevundimonas sp. BR2-1]|uniref:hypothetical protein n=1 Tax=Brevundimonas sp. BR2-1 TaxID=3031123 RepID=UPI0030B679B7